MKQTIIRLFSLLLLGMVATGAQATPFKNIYVKLSANIPGAGTVYMKTDDPENAETAHSTSSVEMKATIGENGDEEGYTDESIKGLYECWLYAMPEDGYELVGFTKVLKNNVEDYVESDFLVQAKKKDSNDNSHVDGFRVNVNSKDCPVKRTSNMEGYGADQARADARADGGWSENPDHHFYAIFKPSTVPVNRVSVAYFQPWLSGMQDETFGTWTNEMINEASKVKLTAIPAAGMRFVCWRDANNQELTTDLEYIVDNVASSYKAEFNLAPHTLPAELSTYSNKKQTRYDNWNGEDLTAYKVTAVNDKLTLVKVRHANPGEGVILQGVAGQEYEMSYQGLYLDEHNDDNLLKGTANGSVDANGKIYVLATGNNGVGFYKLANGQQVPPNKAYLEIDDANNARDFFGFDDGTTTSISSVTEVEQPTPIYNMAGQRVSSSFSGLVIQNGRKYIRK